MKKAKSLQLSANILRIILAVSLFIILAGAIAGFVFAHQKLTGYAVDISKKKVDAEASETVIQSLEAITKQLEDNAEVRETAGSLRLDDNHPEFSVSRELRSIADRNNIKVTLTTASPTTDGATTTPPATPSPTESVPVAPSDTFSITMAVRPKGKQAFNETSFRDFLQFLRDLEQNLPKIKINGVRVSSGAVEDSDSSNPDETPDNNGISVEPISLEVYIKK